MKRPQLIAGLVALLVILGLVFYFAQVNDEPENGDDLIGENNETEPDELFLLLVVVDETEEVPADNLEIVINGEESWTPDFAEAAADDTTIGPFSVNQEVELFVYPDGRDEDGQGREIVFLLTIHAGVVSESEEDAVTVTVTDATVRLVATTAEPNEQAVDRFAGDGEG